MTVIPRIRHETLAGVFDMLYLALMTNVLLAVAATAQ
jgi:hypothetical protein